MKELYISPELEILCFLPVEGIANEATWQNQRAIDDGLSTSESRPGDYDEPVDPDEGLR